MAYLWPFIVLTSVALANNLRDIKCENSRVVAELRQLATDVHLLRIQRKDEKSISSLLSPDWTGMQLLFKISECDLNYCEFQDGEHIFSAWKTGGEKLDIKPPLRAKLLLSTRLHLEVAIPVSENAHVLVQQNDDFSAQSQCSGLD